MANSNRETNTSYDGMGNSSRNLETYDASGRLDSVTASGDTLNLAYNGVGELARTELTRPDNCTNAVFTLAIDDFVFTPDGHALHVRSANTAAVSVDYLWLDDLPVAQFQDSYDAQGVYIGTEATYLHSDHLGTPRIGTNAGKQITWRNRSDAFGIADLSGSAVVRLRFPGQLSLGVAGLNYNYYRDYDPKVGRYVESDPIGIKGGLNTYEYARSNPVLFSDPRGLSSVGGIVAVNAVRNLVKNITETGEIPGPFGPVCGNPMIAQWIPDLWMKDECQEHDDCYATCNASKLGCDLQFLVHGGSIAYFVAISEFGDRPYRKAQKEACKGCAQE